MRILGLHTAGHDTGVCLFEDGRLLFSIETERLTRQRFDHRVEFALQYFLEHYGDKASSTIDLIAISTNINSHVARVPDLDLAMKRISQGALCHETTSSVLGKPIRCLIVAHEASHAALACHFAGYPRECLVFVNEGRGTFSRNSLFTLRSGKLELRDSDSLPWYGTGFGWSAVGFLLGFGRNPGVAGKVMSLGGYGEPKNCWREKFLAVSPTADRQLRSELEIEFAEIAAALSEPCTFDDKAAAVATLQQLFNDSVSDFLLREMAHLEIEKLALGGGCALNVLSNSLLRDKRKIDLHIAPACNDSGQALGAAVYAQMFHLGIRPSAFSVYSNGLSPNADETASLLQSSGFPTQPYSVEAVASVLASGGVVAFCTGVAEIGPRALGNRSLLANPSVPGMRERVSVQLKGREFFRPVAPVMRQERFREEFPFEPDSPYMLYAYHVDDKRIAEAVHVDGTARIQTVTAEDNQRLHSLLEAFEQQTGVPALINTSLNAQGKAIAYTPADVLDDFADTVQLFVFDDLMVTAGGTA